MTRSRAPFPAAVRLYRSSDIHFRNVHVNAESGYGICDENGCGTFLRVSKFPYENAIEDATHHLEVREREFAVLDIPENPPLPPTPDASAVLAQGEKVRKLEDGFFSIFGAAVDAEGKLYFVDHHQQRIYAWSEREGLTIVRDNPLDPVNLAFDKSGNLIVLSSAGAESTVYTFKPGASAESLTVLQPQPAAPHPGATFILPANYWNNGEFEDQLNLETMRFTTLGEMFAADVTTPKPREYVSPDGSPVLPAGRVFQQGPASDTSGWRFSDNLDTYGFLEAKPGDRIYVSSESEDTTYSRAGQRRWHARRAQAFRRSRRRECGHRSGREHLRRQRPDLCLLARRKADCADRRPRAPAAANLRWRRSQNALLPCASCAVRGARALRGPEPVACSR